MNDVLIINIAKYSEKKITKLTGEIQIAQEDGHQEKKTSFLSEKRGRKFSDQARVKSN